MPVLPDKPVAANDRATALKRFLARHPFVTFMLMGLTFLLVGLISLNLIYLFNANLEFVINNGVMGLRDGGLLQLVELVTTGYLGMALYVLFKTCEKVVVERLLEAKSGATGNAPNQRDFVTST
jgi:hypothetical protein